MEKIVVLTGVSSGIGLETAKQLIASGFRVFGLSRKPFELEGLVHIPCDVSSEEEVKSAIQQISQHGNIAILINNAGLGISGSIEHTSLESAKNLFNINFFGTFLMTKHALPHMQPGSKIINIGSVAGELPIAFQAFYSSSKAAVQSFSDCLRMEVKPFGIFVSTILPGDTKTGFTAARVKTASEGRYASRVESSVQRMEKDEQSGMPASSVAKVIADVASRRHPPHKVVVGVQYKLICVLAKFLPRRFVHFILSKLYA